MKRIVMIALLSLPMSALAEHMDVIEFELHEGCSFSNYMEIINDFNEWGENYGYKTKIAMPLQSGNLTSMYWLGTSADAATFGKAWDAWRDGQADPDSTPAKLQARFADCETNLGRRGYDIY